MYDKNLLLHQVLKIVHFSIPIPNSEFVLCRMNINIPENFGKNTVIHTTLTHVWKNDIKFLLRTFKSSFNVINILLSWLCFISEQEFPANLWLLWSNSWTKHWNKIFTRQNFLSGKIFTGQNFLSNTRGYIFSKGQNFSPTKIFARKDNIRPSPNPPTPNVGGDDRFFSKKCS